MKHCLNVDWSNWANFFGLPKMLSVTSSNAKISQSNKWTLLLNLFVVLALDDVTDNILEARICVNIYIGIVIIHGCLLICEYGGFKMYHFALFTLSLWYFIFFLLNSYILLTCAFYHINRFAATFVSWNCPTMSCNIIYG